MSDQQPEMTHDEWMIKNLVAEVTDAINQAEKGSGGFLCISFDDKGKYSTYILNISLGQLAIAQALAANQVSEMLKK